ncbi:class D beta-lactamase [Hazenella sp. IB182353]|uniref:class D beta-lactamase n=1 Tax=Polycladospora coralii TaxID=2771432 RepID=UPI001746D047|nr:class D beta-lactamase [Polycladospora coralii]
MKWMSRISLILFSVFVLTVSMGSSVKAGQQDVEEFHTGQGTMVLKNLKNNHVYIYNTKRSKERFTPESTFKVANALIGLETSAVRDEYEVKRWDGVEREFENWNRDHSLASAMRESAIWFYQDMARTIGEEEMQKNISRFNYGNQDISGGIDTFWLGSSMKISALEQVVFIEKLVEEQLPIAEKHQKTVKRMMIQDEQDEYILHGKTGTRLSDLGLGWYVGFVENEQGIWVFAVNVDGTGTLAKNIMLKELEKRGIITQG